MKSQKTEEVNEKNMDRFDLITVFFENDQTDENVEYYKDRRNGKYEDELYIASCILHCQSNTNSNNWQILGLEKHEACL